MSSTGYEDMFDPFMKAPHVCAFAAHEISSYNHFLQISHM